LALSHPRATFGEYPLEFGFRDCGGRAGPVREVLVDTGLS
jgi:hypothetical protein